MIESSNFWFEKLSKWTFEVLVYTYNLHLELGPEVWSWHLKYRFVFEVWTKSLMMYCKVEIRILDQSRRLKPSTKIDVSLLHLKKILDLEIRICSWRHWDDDV